MSSEKPQEKEFSFKDYFVPLTTTKASHFIILVGIIIYANSLMNSFAFDDMGSIVTNPSVHSLANIPNLFVKQLTGFDANIFYRPIPFIIYTYIYNLFGISSFFYHLVQVLVHIVNSVLIFFLFKRFLKITTAFIAALIFLIHPINHESVVYISALPETLFVFWGLIALQLLQTKFRNNMQIYLALICLFISILSKETGFLFVILGFLQVFLFQKENVLKFSVGSITIAIIYALMRFNAGIQHPEIPVVPIMDLSFLERMKNLPEIIFFYIRTSLFPTEIVHSNSWFIKNINVDNFYRPLFFDVLFLAGFLWIVLHIKSRDRKRIVFFLAWFFIGFSIHLQILSLDATVASRYFYSPFIGLLALLAMYVEQIKLSKLLHWISIGMLTLLLFYYGVKIVTYNHLWRNQESIVTHDQQFARDDYLQELLYSSELIKQEKYTEAYPHAVKATELYPKSYYAWNNVGVSYYYTGNVQKAKEAYERSMSLAPYYGTYDNMALLLLEHDSLENAKTFIRDATKKFPNDEKLWGYRIYVEYKAGNKEQAKEAAKYYYLLRKDKRSQYYYDRLKSNQPIEI